MEIETQLDNITRNLHDGLSQNIALALMAAERLPECNEKNQLCISLNHGSNELRNIMYGLRQVDDFSGSLHKLIKRECRQFQNKFGLKLEVCSGKKILPSSQNEHYTYFFRILHEGLVTVKRHSGINQAEVYLECCSSFVELRIKDQGRGILL